MLDFINNTDIASHQEVYSILSGAFDNWGRSAGNCVWDLSCTKDDGTTISIEVKDRTFDHTKFGDIFAEEAKQTYTKQNYNFDKSLAINRFKDGVIAIANLYDPAAKHFKKFCPKETWPGGDHTYVWKNCVSLPQTVKYKKDENGKWRRI